MDGSGDHHAEQDKPSSKGQTSHAPTNVEPRPKMMIMVIKMGHGISGNREGERERKGYYGVKRIKYPTHIYMKTA
jgi:hypothetical protein